MGPQAPHQPNVHLNPGELAMASPATLIETVLGSCVSVALYCPFQGIGAMCHAMLPTGDATVKKTKAPNINTDVGGLFYLCV